MRCRAITAKGERCQCEACVLGFCIRHFRLWQNGEINDEGRRIKEEKEC